MRGHGSVVSVLLDANASVHLAADFTGITTPLDYAVAYDQIDIAKQLIARGAVLFSSTIDMFDAPSTFPKRDQLLTAYQQGPAGAAADDELTNPEPRASSFTFRT